MNQISNNASISWKQNALHSSRPANQHGQPPFPPGSDAGQQTSLARNAKKVICSLYALKIRND